MDVFIRPSKLNVDELEKVIMEEINQRRDEGCDVEDFIPLLYSARGKRELLLDLYSKISGLEVSKGFRYSEPMKMEEIKREREGKIKELGGPLAEEVLYDKILGGWLGRCAGCILGKPVEGWSNLKIRTALEKAGIYPLVSYFPEKAIREGLGEFPRWLYPCTLGNIEFVERDDDLDYTILGLLILEKHLLDFETLDVGEMWLERFPYHMVYTAERVAYRNLVNGLKPPETALNLNPYREWIGARIRADIWGYVTPGDIELASELAYKDATLSHVKNGVYAEMLASSMISAAFFLDDVEEIIETGLRTIPKGSRLHEVVKSTMAFWREGLSWEEALERTLKEYGKYHGVHSINNTAVSILALLYGEKDFGKAIALAVMAGLDTDCNGAMVGSLLGVMLGASKIPKSWTACFNDRIKSGLSGISDERISRLSQRTLSCLKKIRNKL